MAAKINFDQQTIETINQRLLTEELDAQLGVPCQVSVSMSAGQISSGSVVRADGQEFTAQQVADALAVIAAHDSNQKTDVQQIIEDAKAQRISIQDDILPHLNQLRGLSPDAAMYALLARFGAIFNEEDQPTIEAILDRPSAGNYIQSTTQWAGLSAAQRQWAILELEMIAGALQSIIGQM